MTERAAVFVPGFLCDERLWTYQKEAFASEIPCYFIDLRNSKKLQDMLEKLSEIPVKKLNLIGFSMGGYISQVFATQNPDRIDRLVLIGTTGSPLSDIEYKMRLRMRSLLQKVNYGGLSDKELQHYLHPQSLTNANIANLVRTMAADNTSEMYLNQMNATLDRQDLKILLNGLRFPIHLIGANEDQIATKDKLHSFHKAIPRSSLNMIEGSGHFIPLEKPADLNQILQGLLFT